MPVIRSAIEAELPTIEEIHASSQFLSKNEHGAKVAIVREHFAVKFGAVVSLSEAEMMKFIAGNTAVPVPKVHAAFTDSKTQVSYIIMDYVPGSTLESLAPTLSAEEKTAICLQVRECIKELRELPPQGYFGVIGRKPYHDAVHWTPDNDPIVSGPFNTQAELNEGILARLRLSETDTYVQYIKSLMEPIFRGHRPVLTHGDLQPKNIMVNKIGSCEDGSGKFEVTLIDWELSGWYPEFWEYCSATILCRFKPLWLELVQNVLQPYVVEYLMMQQIYNVVYY